LNSKQKLLWQLATTEIFTPKRQKDNSMKMTKMRLGLMP